MSTITSWFDVFLQGQLRDYITLQQAGRVDNTALEARPDVLPHTSDILDDDLEIIGEVCAQLWFRSSRHHADVFVRLCDVDPTGRSTNICDGLTGLTGADELGCVTVALASTRICSSVAIASASRSPAARSPSTTATSAPVNPA
ncbi:CocE/NonD family hydrolase C-terminal non-catalytic domain-containing protein [Nocardia sp. NPDC005745]|uniref:CocE/NonD family hydrolase C-terminal non-catalytic domain-containing protein n=1 Tax=Nocardia sp. NPDC005745 TaxID=3157061 RepID=UPI0033F56F65